jgi:hypothetical protein
MKEIKSLPTIDGTKAVPATTYLVVINFANRSYDDYWINFPNNGTWKVRFNSSWKGYSDDFENIGVSETMTENNSGKLKSRVLFCFIIVTR